MTKDFTVKRPVYYLIKDHVKTRLAHDKRLVTKTVPVHEIVEVLDEDILDHINVVYVENRFAQQVRSKIILVLNKQECYRGEYRVPSQTLDRQTLETTNPNQANTRHNKPKLGKY